MPDVLTAVTAGKLAETYLKIRDKRAELKKAFEEEDKKLEDAMDTLSAEMLEKCKEEEAGSIRTPFGTIIRSVRRRFWAADWDELNKFILENKAIELLEKRVHQTNMATWMEEHPDATPPGLNVDSKYVCSVRKK